DVLDPRPDTETLVEAALAALGPRRGEPLRLVDFGTGSGAVAAALLAELPAAFAVALDRAPAAARLARDNLRRNGLADRAAVLVGDWDAALAGGFDLVVSNPPYIPAGDIAGLAPEVRLHDPRLALDGGPDGLDAYRRLAPAAARLLAPGGLVLFEVGAGQAPAVAALLAAAGLSPAAPARDLAGRERVAIARAPGG
ncbi:MAG: HemK family protein methyltransferase, partial [Methylobacteriaceae bacterium]|nr:HemK family protein methyltransferase [Methylobacteriaceae bacterium]